MMFRPFALFTGGGTGMEPISASVLIALATGAAGEAGRQLWTSLGDLVRRTPEAPDGQETSPGSPASATGENELAALNETPNDPARARQLSEALSHRAQRDPAFRSSFTQWLQQARTQPQALRTGDGDTSNTVSGNSTQHGPVLQGRDFSGVNFHAPEGN